MIELINSSNPPKKLSKTDKEIIKILLNDESTTMEETIKKIGIPRTTFQRRLKYLKKYYIRTFHYLNSVNLNFRRLDLLIGISGDTAKIAKHLLLRKEVVLVCRRIGEHDIDLQVKIIINDNLELARLIDDVKTIEGVKNVKWSEVVEICGKKKSIPDLVIDSL